MKLKKLEILLEKAEGFQTPDVRYEQYKTPATLAAPFLHMAFMSDDIAGKTVYDFGCGTGIFTIGAAVLGASAVKGFDIDESAILNARRNADQMRSEISDSDIDFSVLDISFIPALIQSGELQKADTILMNPPFGAQEKGNDRPFLEAAIAAGDVVYSIHNKGSRAFIEKFIKPAVITDSFTAEFPIKKTFDFHKKEIQTIDVEIYRIETKCTD